jgi:hypothetical protein
MTEATTPPPILRVVRGGVPDDDELAAVVAVLAARATATAEDESRPLRQPLSPWVTSGLTKGARTKV